MHAYIRKLFGTETNFISNVPKTEAFSNGLLKFAYEFPEKINIYMYICMKGQILYENNCVNKPPFHKKKKTSGYN